MIHAKELKQYAAQSLAELYGTFILILIGEAAVAQYKFIRQPTQTNLPIHICFGIGTYVALMVAGPISGKVQRKNKRVTTE
jgi:glycerol uptake facilitator-like aquaporin